MKDELKKHCISILTEQHFDLFDAVQTGVNGVPQIDLFENAAEGPYVRFFEQAFEWEQMTWLTYPYFWGRKSQWHERIAYEDPDPVFNQFLKAGYCRVVVPVRPGFEGAIDHFMTYGEIWNGGPLPPISNPLYLPIADEIAERLDRPGEEIPQGDPGSSASRPRSCTCAPTTSCPNGSRTQAASGSRRDGMDCNGERSELMGDISRHRDIYFNTRGAIPPSLLDKCRRQAGDLTYLELGNYMTDVSQFRDPVSYIFAKRRVWKKKVLPKAENAKDFIQGLAIFVGTVVGGALAVAGKSK